MALTAALALLFDVTPGLRGPGGYVVWFFAFSVFFFLIPAASSRMLDEDRGNDRVSIYDPSGVMLVDRLITASAQAPIEGVALGLNFIDEPIERVPFASLTVDATLVARRAQALAWTAVPLALALLIFLLGTRGRLQAAPREQHAYRPPADLEAAGLVAASPGPSPPPAPAVFHPHAGTPTFARSVLAE